MIVSASFGPRHVGQDVHLEQQSEQNECPFLQNILGLRSSEADEAARKASKQTSQVRSMLSDIFLDTFFLKEAELGAIQSEFRLVRLELERA